MGSKRRNNKPKIIAIVGPTASGKSDLAVFLAQKYKGEVISCDSRQVYRGLDIGTGKITKKEMKGVPHHLLNVANPKKFFDVVSFKKLADKKIEEILKRKKIPILCGGTGLYVDAVAKNIQFPKTKANWDLRKKLDNKNEKELFEMLKKLDPKRAKTIDKHNKRRLIRSIEIAKELGEVKPTKQNPKYDVLYIGITLPKERLKEKIKNRLEKRLKMGMIKEAENLHKKGLSYKKMELLGLEYKYMALFLKGKITKEKMKEELATKINQYAKRQMTWFSKNKKINWITTKKEAEKLTKEFLKQN